MEAQACNSTRPFGPIKNDFASNIEISINISMGATNGESLETFTRNFVIIKLEWDTFYTCTTFPGIYFLI